MLLGVHVTRTEKAKTKDVRRYASLIGSRWRSLERNLRHGRRKQPKRPSLFCFLGTQLEEMLEIVVNGGAVAVTDGREPAAGSSHEGFQGWVGLVTAFVGGEGVGGGVVCTWTSVVTNP